MRYYVGELCVTGQYRTSLYTVGRLRYLGVTPEYMDVHAIGMKLGDDAERCDMHFNRVMDYADHLLVIEAESDNEAFEKFRAGVVQKLDKEGWRQMESEVPTEYLLDPTLTEQYKKMKGLESEEETMWVSSEEYKALADYLRSEFEKIIVRLMK